MNEDVNIENEDDADALLSDIEKPTDETADQVTEPEAKQTIQEYALTIGGKEIKAPIEKVLKWASMGYDAPNKIGELNKALEGYKSKETQFKELEDKYGVVDKYVRENPQWWEHVQSQYQQLQQQQQAQPANPLIDQMAKRLESIEGLASTLQQEREAERAKQDDAKYMEEFESIKKQYPKIDLSTPDENGKSLEYKVLEYAQSNGIRKFTTAFRDFYHDELLKMSSEEAKEKVVNDKQSKSRLGILGVSSTPTKKISDSVKGKSYADLEREALQELGIA